MRLRWTPAAVENLESIYAYLCEYHSSFAQSTVRTLYDSVRSLRHFPERGRVGSVPETREFVLSRLPYTVVYRIAEQTIEVLHIYHDAQDR
jgi:plasmid stabilization system protein ParE